MTCENPDFDGLLEIQAPDVNIDRLLHGERATFYDHKVTGGSPGLAEGGREDIENRRQINFKNWATKSGHGGVCGMG